ncbi:hypothetical protein K7H91_01750 [Martelella mediterranea]|uniref:hypothetical protein n=1 Tax=Martelella mediterranea TaxID=293089 RepID=UPI003AF3F3C0|nr:hypothetical protein [Martelella mediterranea]
MTKTSGTPKDAADGLVRGIKRRTRQYYSAEEKITIVWRDRAGKKSIAGPRRREGIAESLCYSRSKEFLEAGNEADYRRPEPRLPSIFPESLGFLIWPQAACFSSTIFLANSLGVILPSDECGLFAL